MIHKNIENYIDEFGTDFSKNPLHLPRKDARKVYCSIDHKQCHHYALKFLDEFIKKNDSDLINTSPKLYWGYADFVYENYKKRHLHSFLVGNSDGVEVVFDPYIYKLHDEGTKVINHKGVNLPYWWAKNSENLSGLTGKNYSGYLLHHVFTEVNSIIYFTNQVLQKA